MNQRLAVKLLEKQGHTVVLVNNGREALDTLERETFDLVLMDVQMPVLSGLEAAALIREKEKTNGQHLRIIALTANAMSGDREKCLAAGMDGYLSKPIRVEELMAVLIGIYSPESVPTFSTARNASCGISTRPTRFMRRLPSFCFSSSLRLREMSPP